MDTWTDLKTALNAPDAVSGESTAALREFAENWSSPEFVAFVKALQDLVDNLAIGPDTDQWTRALAVWSRVVELESAFWP